MIRPKIRDLHGMGRPPSVEVIEQSLVFGGPDRTGLAGLPDLGKVAEPSVAKRGDRWWMIFSGSVAGAHGNVVQLFTASLPSGAPLTCPDWTITTEDPEAARPKPLLAPPPPGAWDATGYHCPSYVVGWDPTAGHGAGACRERIYYASCRQWSLEGPYSIGVIERVGTRWIRRDHGPVYTGTADEGTNVAEQNLIYHDGAWHMYYLAAPPQHYLIGHLRSRDGLGDWQHRSVFSDHQVCDAAVARAPGGFEMITAHRTRRFSRDPSAPGRGADCVDDGLWWRRAPRSSADRSDWSAPIQLWTVSDGTALKGKTVYYVPITLQSPQFAVTQAGKCRRLVLASTGTGAVMVPARPRVLAHMLTETTRHAGHADILREQLDGSSGR